MTEYTWNQEIRPTTPFAKEELDDRSFFTFGGEIQLDKDITISTSEIHDRLGLDRSRWMIVGIDASLESGKNLINKRGTGDLIHVYAVDRDKLTEEQNKTGRVFDSLDSIEVVSFACHDLSFQEILEGMKTARISLMSKGLRNRKLTVTGYADIPVQEEP